MVRQRLAALARLLVRRLDAVPVLVVGTVRTGEQHVDEELLTELSLEPVAAVVRPAASRPRPYADLVERRLGGPVSPLFALACHRTTSGNPLLLRQLLRQSEPTPSGPTPRTPTSSSPRSDAGRHGMVLMRLRRLPEPAPDVARAAAVLGDGAALPVVAGLARLTEAETAAGLAALARSEIVKDEQPMAFVHPLVRDAVYRGAPARAGRIAARHERAAALLRTAGAADEQVAAHLLLAPAAATRRRSRRCAGRRTAADRGAPTARVTLLRRAWRSSRPGSCVRRPHRARHDRVADRRRRQRRAPAAGLRVDRGAGIARHHRRGDRPHRGVRQPAGPGH